MIRAIAMFVFKRLPPQVQLSIALEWAADYGFELRRVCQSPSPAELMFHVEKRR